MISSGDEPRRGRGRPRSTTADAAIVEAALALLAEGGFAATTVDAIAERSGVSKTTLYRRWRTKEELIADAIGALTADMAPTPAQDVYSGLQAHLHDVARVFSDPLLGRLLPGLLGELHRNPEFAASWADRIVRPRRDAIVALLAAAASRGELRAGVNPDVVADLLVGPLLYRLLFPFGLSKRHGEYADDLLRLIWTGIRPE
jgi:AcrR family transcriptional regulator